MRVYKTIPESERFNAKVMPEPNTGCWLWFGQFDKDGYGLLKTGSKDKWNNERAHRVSYRINIGPIPEGYFICHKCDNPACVNPDHLFAGNHIDNVTDMISKGRKVVAKGSKANKSDLTEMDVLQIRSQYANGNTSYAKLSKKYGVCARMIGAIVNRENWKHI